jgi:hypothetical protein
LREYNPAVERFPAGLNSRRRLQVLILYGVLTWVLLNLLFAAALIWRRVLAVPARRTRPSKLARLNNWRF